MKNTSLYYLSKYIYFIIQTQNSVVVPISTKEDPYYMINCPFDYSKSKKQDLQDDLNKNCDIIIQN